MTITPSLVASGSGGAGAASSHTVSITGTLSKGHCVIISVGVRDTGSVVVSSIAGHGMTFVAIPNTAVTGGAMKSEVWIGFYTANSSAVNPSWTVNLSGSASSASGSIASIWADVSDANTNDKQQTGNNNSTTPSTGTTASTTFLDELLIATFAWFTNDTITTGPDNSFSLVLSGAVGTAMRISQCYKTVSATGAYTCGVTITTGRQWVASIATLRARQTKRTNDVMDGMSRAA